MVDESSESESESESGSDYEEEAPAPSIKKAPKIEDHLATISAAITDMRRELSAIADIKKEIGNL